MMSTLRQTRLWQRIFRSRAEDTLPHTVEHRRIYIIPSQRGCAFLLTLMIMLMASINYALSLGYALCFVLTGLFAATLLHTYRNLAGLSIGAIQARDAFCGDTVEFTLTLQNQHSRVRHGIRIATDNGAHVRVRAPAQATLNAVLPIRARARGVCRLGRLTLQSDWPLGLWTCWSYLHVARQALVFPAPEQPVPALPQQAGIEDEGLSGIAAAGDVAGLRDYQPGDSMGSIAWKSAAKGLGLRSRLFDSVDAPSETILDLQQAAVPGLEAKLSRLCAWVLAAEASRTDYALRLAGPVLEKGCGKQHRRQALEALALYAQGDAAGMRAP